MFYLFDGVSWAGRQTSVSEGITSESTVAVSSQAFPEHFDYLTQNQGLKYTISICLIPSSKYQRIGYDCVIIDRIIIQTTGQVKFKVLTSPILKFLPVFKPPFIIMEPSCPYITVAYSIYSGFKYMSSQDLMKIINYTFYFNNIHMRNKLYWYSLHRKQC